MSTFLVSLGVVVATIAAVVYIVLNGQDQPPTIRRQPSRGKGRSERPTREGTTLPGRGTTLGVRIRSSVVLVLLVAILGALLALAIAGLALGLTLLVRSATA